ncbi:rapamycin-insensitive companion of mTOR-like isoform X2 [Oppia nitens]|uniref:rapamycin-insensitive companion of mTOR-like isoform X2 n=1 Tax=Oppia nitens TaxID=1686743 RepID=UPI0023D9DFD1|nr:rapamycin-insensitive companion of mTOR-like isoform X2 [Oppia nitens]
MSSIYRYNRSNLRNGRTPRKRYDSEDDNIAIDWSKPLNESLQEILYNITRKDGVSKGQRLAYLNCFTKFCTKVQSISQDICGLTVEEIFCCIRVALFHEAGEVRGAGLRAMRYLLRDEESVEAFCRVNLPLLICRSIDIVLDNRLERIQALRLVRQLLSLNPKKFPLAITRCLVSIAKDGVQERDMLVRACWATLTELTILNPQLSQASGGLSSIIKSVLQSNQTHNISEALISSLLFLLNSSKTRHLIRSDLDLQHFIAPFTDVHGFGGEFCDSPEQRLQRYTASKNAILSILRSWPGIVYMCRVFNNDSVCKTSNCAYLTNNIYSSETLSDIPNGIEALINMLHLPYTEIQRYILELVFELFNVPIPEWTDDFDVALMSSDISSMQDMWHIYDGFVAAEGKAILPLISQNRANLMDNYLALVLHSFINFGIIEAIVSVILNSSDSCCSVTATILLGELLHLSSCLLPSDCSHRCQSLPTLMTASISSMPKKRELANASVSNLNRIHELKKRGSVAYSLYLEQLLHFCQPSAHHNNTNNKITKSKFKYNMKKNADETVMQMIKNSQILRRDYMNWDWDLIDIILRWPAEALKKLDDNNHKEFIKKLIQFYKPGKKFSQISNTDEKERIMCSVGQHLIDFLLEADDSKIQEYIQELFDDLDECFSQIAVETPPQNAILSPGRLLSTLSHSYFLFIGRLTNSSKGKKWLEKTRIYQHFLDLISLCNHDVYMKLIVSSLDYSTEVNNFSRTLLNKVLTSVSETARLYATNYLRVLLRARASDYSKWAIELLVLQLYDKSAAISLAAIDILQEACDCPENLEQLIQLRPSLLHLGDKGLLLLVRYLSLPTGFKFLRDANFIDYELNRWQKTFNLKYVKLAEDVLNECFTCHIRSEDGTYGRRSDKKGSNNKNAFIPPHLYGQLAQTCDGYELLLKEDCLSQHYDVIRSPDFSTELGVLRLKASLWVIGHIGATHLGYRLISETEMIEVIIKLTAESPILSVRGTCFNVLCLIATTPDGCEALQEFGWDAIRHSRHEKFCLVEEPNVERLRGFSDSRTHASSVSTASNNFELFSGKDLEISSERFVSFNYNQQECTYSGSLPSLTVESDGESKHKKVSLPSKVLPRVMSLSPHHYRNVIDLRPRSSSDTPNAKQELQNKDNTDSESGSGIWLRQKSNESVVHSGVLSTDMDSSSSTLTPTNKTNNTYKQKTLTVQETPKRKISEPFGVFYSTLVKDERSDSNESSHNSSNKSRSGSFADSTSGVSAGSCDSASLTPSQKLRNNLSPIASLSSISNSTQSTTIKSSLANGITNTFLRPVSKIFTSNTNTLNTSESIPSAIDAYGYQTLRAIQKRRVQSLSYASFEERRSSEETEDNIRDRIASAIAAVERRNTRLESTERSDSSDSDNRNFMALCLPKSLFLIFEVENGKPKTNVSLKLETKDMKTHLDRLSNEEIVFNDGLEFHDNMNCLFCFRNKGYSQLINNNNLVNHTFVKTPNNDSMNIPNTILNRREILRFVTNLCGSVHSKQAEQGLLNLKQKCSQAFEDICLYSEICLQLSTYNFRMSARRFLQELFLDVNFNEIFTEADNIVRLLSDKVMTVNASESDTKSANLAKLD